MPDHIEIDRILREAKSLLASSGTGSVLFRGSLHTESPTVSVIVTTYGANEMLFRAVDSICEQDFEGSVEIILSYDRGTRPGTFVNMEKWIRNSWQGLQDVRILFHDNMSLFRDRELSMFHSVGKYITFLDYDNRYHVDRLRLHIDYMEGNGVHFTFSNQMDVDAGGVVIKDVHLRVPDDYRDVKTLLFQNFVDSNTIMFDRSFYSQFLLPSLNVLSDRFFDGIIEDYLYALVASITGNLNYIDRVMGDYTYHKGNITSRLYEKNDPSEYVMIARYNERIFKTLVAIALVNQQNSYSKSSLFSVFINIIDQKDLQLLAVNSGIEGGSSGLPMKIAKAVFILFTKLRYILIRMRSRRNTPLR